MVWSINLGCMTKITVVRFEGEIPQAKGLDFTRRIRNPYWESYKIDTAFKGGNVFYIKAALNSTASNQIVGYMRRELNIRITSVTEETVDDSVLSSLFLRR
jgi:hypothetical protein